MGTSATRPSAAVATPSPTYAPSGELQSLEIRIPLTNLMLRTVFVSLILFALSSSACTTSVGDYVSAAPEVSDAHRDAITKDAPSATDGTATVDSGPAPDTTPPTEVAPPSCKSPTPDLCQATCTDLSRDPLNCGICGNVCSSGNCKAGGCRGN
ncbi:MAG: hypothetical protein NVSMB1_09400 [Polyangiales bacterium]